MNQYNLSFSKLNDSRDINDFEVHIQHLFNQCVHAGCFKKLAQQPYAKELTIYTFFQITDTGYTFSTIHQNGFAFFKGIDIPTFIIETICKTAHDLSANNIHPDLAWKLSVKDLHNTKINRPITSFHKLVPDFYWEHFFIGARNALMDFFLRPAAECSNICTKQAWNNINTNLLKFNQVAAQNLSGLIPYRCLLYTPPDAKGIHNTTDDWREAAEIELFAEEPYATFLHRDTWKDLEGLLAASGISPEIAIRFRDGNGKSLLISV